jgi:hypothetical protein
MTEEERTHIREAACRYVREQAPMPPIAILERIARIVLQARGSPRVGDYDRASSPPDGPVAA